MGLSQRHPDPFHQVEHTAPGLAAGSVNEFPSARPEVDDLIAMFYDQVGAHVLGFELHSMLSQDVGAVLTVISATGLAFTCPPKLLSTLDASHTDTFAFHIPLMRTG